MQRRNFLKGSIATSALLVAASAGVLVPKTVLAAWPKDAFAQKSIADGMSKLYGSSAASDVGEDKIKIKAPDIAENGAVVPVTVTVKGIDKVENISIFAGNNATPLAASFQLSEGTLPVVATRIKMGKTANIVAIAHANGKSYRAKKEVKITIGGCGG